MRGGCFLLASMVLVGVSAVSGATVRVAAVAAKARTIDSHLSADGALAGVDQNLSALEKIIQKAADAHCDCICFPEDTMGLLNWNGVHAGELKQVLPRAVQRMIQRLGRATALHGMYLIVCSDMAEQDGVYNTAFFLGRDGKEIGRYHKACPAYHEGRTPGKGFPVYPTKDLGTVGMLICYDLVFPETARCEALQGADIIFVPTMGTAAIGDDDIGVQALRVRAVENFVWLVVAHRGGGAMIISPQGKIIAKADRGDGLAIADVDVRGGRQGGDAMNFQQDMRARLFRERNPEAFGVLTDPKPPALAKLPINLSREQAAQIASRALTVGEEEFKAASALAAQKQIQQAIEAFSRLRREYPGTWIDRVSEQRLGELQPQAPVGQGLAARFPGDAGIDKDPSVIFVEDFEEHSLETMQKRWETVSQPKSMSFSDDVPPGGGKQSLLMTHIGGQGTGAQLYRRLPRGYDQIFARFYVKFDPDCYPIHHFGTCIGGNNPPTRWPMVSAGNRPSGDKSFWIGIEPFGKSWTWDYYTYWCEMRGSPPRGQTWGNSFIRDPKLKVELGKWTCIEVMVKINQVGQSDGEMALWIDGKPVSHLGKGFPKGKWTYDKFLPGEEGEQIRWNEQKGGPERFNGTDGGDPFEGFRWRTSKGLDLNFVWAYLYITDAPAGHVSKVWFDDIVVATQYIGPIAR